MPRRKNQTQHDAKRKEKRKQIASRGLYQPRSSVSQVNSSNFFKPPAPVVISPKDIPAFQTTVDATGFKINGFPISLDSLPSGFKKLAGYCLSTLLLTQTVEAADLFKQQFFSIGNHTIRMDTLNNYFGFITSPAQQVTNCGGEELNFTPSGDFSLVHEISNWVGPAPSATWAVVERLFSLVGQTLPDEIRNCLVNEMDHAFEFNDTQKTAVIIALIACASCIGACVLGCGIGYWLCRKYEINNQTNSNGNNNNSNYQTFAPLVLGIPGENQP